MRSKENATFSLRKRLLVSPVSAFDLSFKKNLKSLSLSLSLEEIEIFDSERKKRETRRRFARARERAVQKKVRKGRGGRAVFQNAFKRDFFLKKKRENARPRKKFEF